MKTFTSFILAASTLILFTNCAPKDKNLNRPSFKNNGFATNGLRVGSYGQTIWAMQNIEQIGSLFRMCDQSTTFKKELRNGETKKSCGINFASGAKSAPNSGTGLSEKWDLQIVYRNETEEIISASGRLFSDDTEFMFKGVKASLRFSEKTFVFQALGEKRFNLEIILLGKIESASESFDFSQRTKSEVFVPNQESWSLTNLEQKLEIPQRKQIFNISSPSMKLDWARLLCADFSGEMSAVEVGKSPGRINVSKTSATQITTNGRPGYSQPLISCDQRELADLNVEFLFY